MVKYNFLKPKHLVLLVALAVIIEWYYFLFEPLAFSRFKAYSQNPLIECLTKDSTDKIDKCKDNFDKKCMDTNNVVRTKELDTTDSQLKGCFKKAPDTGKACALSSECLSGFCNLKIATTNKTCKLISEQCGIGVNFDNNGEQSPTQTTTRTYKCNTKKPGRCSEAPDNINNDTKTHLLKMKDNLLLEKFEGEKD